MKAYIYLNEAPDHYRGWGETHAGSLELGGTLTPPDVGNDVETLETVFAFCNGQDPQSEVLWYDLGNRSLSVGDVVVLEDAAGDQRAYACASAGWLKLADGSVMVLSVP